MKSIRGLILLSLLVISLSSCTPEEIIKACTKIGCSDGITIVVNSSLATSATVEISYDGMTQTIACAQGRCISNNIFFENITPDSLTVKIVDKGTVLYESTHTPTYNVNQPNGPDCPPDCKQSTINVET